MDRQIDGLMDEWIKIKRDRHSDKQIDRETDTERERKRQ